MVFNLNMTSLDVATFILNRKGTVKSHYKGKLPNEILIMVIERIIENKDWASLAVLCSSRLIFDMLNPSFVNMGVEHERKNLLIDSVFTPVRIKIPGAIVSTSDTIQRIDTIRNSEDKHQIAMELSTTINRGTLKILVSNYAFGNASVAACYTFVGDLPIESFDLNRFDYLMISEKNLHHVGCKTEIGLIIKLEDEREASHRQGKNYRIGDLRSGLELFYEDEFRILTEDAGTDFSHTYLEGIEGKNELIGGFTPDEREIAIQRDAWQDELENRMDETEEYEEYEWYQFSD